jgi:cobalt-zinc-cadmium efflux system membrane fusion protein
MKNIIIDKISGNLFRKASKKVKLITLSSIFTSVALASTTALSYSAAAFENTQSVTQSIVEKEEHSHEDKRKTVHDESGHNHENETQENEHGKEQESDGGHGHGHEKTSEQNSEEEHEEGISFSPEKMALASIKVSTLMPKIFAKSVYAPGEIKANGYTSYIVSPRTESVVISRHAILGEHVTKGQALVTLFSESMAEAQAKYRVAFSEWQRTKKLGLGTVSESRLLASETDYISAYGRLKAFGLTKAAIQDIVKNN